MTKKYKIGFEDDLFDFQQEIFELMTDKDKRGTYRFLIAVIGRQSGKSYMDKRIALELSNNQSKHGWWVFPTYSSAREHWAEILDMLETSGLPVKKVDRSNFTIDFYGGGHLAIKSADSGDTMRGGTLDYVIMDEAAFYRNGQDIWEKVLMPMLTASRGIMLTTTTPNGRNWVYGLYSKGQDEKDKYHWSIRKPSTESPAQDREFLEYLRTTMTKRAWEQEFMAKFLADGGGVFAGVEVAATVDMLTQPEEHAKYIMGVDFGKNDDATCVTILDKHKRKQVYGQSMNNMGTMKTFRKILRIMREWEPEITVFEKNGLGEDRFEIIRDIVSPRVASDAVRAMKDKLQGDLNWLDDMPPLRVEAVHMDNATKRSMVERLSSAIEYGRLEILNDESEYGKTQVSEMSTYEEKRTASGLNITYDASSGNHDDTISALYLAYSEMPKIKFTKTWENSDREFKNPFKNRDSRPATHRVRRKHAQHNSIRTPRR